MRLFPMQPPQCAEDAPLMGAFYLARQKWYAEQKALDELREVERGKFPLSVIHAAQKSLAFAENETLNAVQLFCDEQSYHTHNESNTHLRSA